MKREATPEPVGTHERASATPGAAAPVANRPKGVPTAAVPEHLLLREHQQLFENVITTPESEPLPVDERRARRLVVSGALTASERLEIYRRSYHARLVECLADDYPVLQYALGEQPFQDHCRRYIARHPSTGPNLNTYGEHMAAFCLGHAPAPIDGHLARDIATLEWAIVQTIHAPTATPLSSDDLLAVPSERWPEVRLVPNPSLRILHLAFPVNVYLQAHREAEAPQLPSRSDTWVAVFRTGMTVWRMELMPAMAALFTSLARGLALGAAIAEAEPLLREMPDASSRVMSGFSSGVASGLFAGIEL